MVTDCAACPLRQKQCFDPLEKDELAFMRKFKVGELKVDAGTTLLMEGSNSPQLFTALRGMGLRYKLLPDGSRQVVNFVLPGDFIGLQAGVMGEMQHSVEATSPMTLCVFDRTDLWTMFRHQPTLAYDLTRVAAMEEYFLGEALASIGQMSAMGRMCWGLLRFFTRCQHLDLVQNDTCAFPFRQQDLADALGLSLVHTNKTLMKLRNLQMLSLQNGELRILDAEKIAEITGMHLDIVKKRPLI